MKRVFAVCGLLCTLSSAPHAQRGVAGTWRTEQPDRPSWDIVLRTDGTALRGTVSDCASVRLPIPIFDGVVEGNTIRFKCQSGDGQRTASFIGVVKGDEILFTRETGGNPGGRGVFGPPAPHQFTARRVRDGDLPKVDYSAIGTNFTTGVNLLDRDIRASADLSLPASARRVRAVVVVIRYGVGSIVLDMPGWQELADENDAALLRIYFDRIRRGDPAGLGATDAEGRAAALVAVLNRLAEESGHVELRRAPLVFWGHSIAGSYAAMLAASFPARTVGFVTYQSSPPSSGDSFGVVNKIPALILYGGKDSQRAITAAENTWKAARADDAPWAYTLDPEAFHGDDPDGYPYVKQADALMIPWVAALIRQRVPRSGTGLHPVNDASAWLANRRTGEIVPAATYSGPREEASWLPDEVSAKGWRVASRLAN